VLRHVHQRRAMAVAGFLALCCGSCSKEPADLPEPRVVTLVREPCLAPAPPPPEPLLAHEDPGRCLAESESRQGVPLAIVVSNDGRISRFSFHDHCSGKTYDLGPTVETCVRSALEKWRFLPWTVCPGDIAEQWDELRLYPPSAKRHWAGRAGVRVSCG
jgi:hypothetical protein